MSIDFYQVAKDAFKSGKKIVDKCKQQSLPNITLKKFSKSSYGSTKEAQKKDLKNPLESHVILGVDGNCNPTNFDEVFKIFSERYPMFFYVKKLRLEGGLSGIAFKVSPEYDEKHVQEIINKFNSCK